MKTNCVAKIVAPSLFKKSKRHITFKRAIRNSPILTKQDTFSGHTPFNSRNIFSRVMTNMLSRTYLNHNLRLMFAGNLQETFRIDKF